MANIPSKSKKVYAIITVDGDLRVGNLEQRRGSIYAMRETHANLGIIGRTTWFINEFDFHWTELYPDVLLDLTKSGDLIGIHDHQDTQFATTYSQIYRLMSDSKSRVESFFLQADIRLSIVAHRNGCAIQSRAIYKALKALGYTILSDVRPGVAWYARMVRTNKNENVWKCLSKDDPDAIFTDNSQIPLSTGPWRHDDHNWMDYRCRKGHFIQIPITSMPLVDKDRVRKVVDSSSENVFIVIDTHPYDLQDTVSGNIDQESVLGYQQSIDWIRTEFGASFISVNEVSKVLTWN